MAWKKVFFLILFRTIFADIERGRIWKSYELKDVLTEISNLMPSGIEPEDKHWLYVCQGFNNGHFFPGKIHYSRTGLKCWVAEEDPPGKLVQARLVFNEENQDKIKILAVPTWLTSWVRIKAGEPLPTHYIAGGSLPGGDKDVAVCRTFENGGVFTGGYYEKSGECIYSEYEHINKGKDDVEILTFNMLGQMWLRGDLKM